MFFEKPSSEVKDESVKRTVSKAFLIKGGTQETRHEKYLMLIKAEPFLMYGIYSGENELVVIFSKEYSDFDEMTFQEAKKLAGEMILGLDFEETTFGKQPRFGIVDLTELNQTFKCKNIC